MALADYAGTQNGSNTPLCGQQAGLAAFAVGGILQVCARKPWDLLCAQAGMARFILYAQANLHV